MKRFAVPLVALIAVTGLLWRYPLVHIVRLAEAQGGKPPAAFDAREYVGKFWDERLPAALQDAHEAVEVAAAVQQDSKAARERFGRSVGLSRGYFLFVKGVGEIASVEKNTIGLAVGDGRGVPAVALVTGPIFGNAARDAPGLIAASDFANSQDFNAISQELNRRIESQVIPLLAAQAKVGRRVRFVGCVEVRGESGEALPLKVVPLSVQIE